MLSPSTTTRTFTENLLRFILGSLLILSGAVMAKEKTTANHWAFTLPQRHEAPAVRDAQWSSHPHDVFILKKLEGTGLEPNPPADPRTLLRRLSFDLTGLPPTPEEMAAFEMAFQEDPDASLKELTDRLLASPQFGARWARIWLDLARYAEDQAHIVGDNSKLFYPNAWLYRDWVINPLSPPRMMLSTTSLKKQIPSSLDTVLDKAKAVNRELGKQDQEKFAEYLDSVRGLEKKIDQQRPWLDRPKPTTEMAEPRPAPQTADEMKIMMELMALAIETDSTRVMTLSSGFANGDFGLQGGYHGFSHHGELPEKTEALKLIEGNQIAQMAYLIELLKGKEDSINGGTLFDHTMILFGCGMATGTHSCKNMPLVLAGGGFKLGDHRALPEGKTERVKACNLLLSMLQNFGLEVDQFGTSTGTRVGLSMMRRHSSKP